MEPDQGSHKRDKDKDFEVLVSLTMEDCNALVDKLDDLKYVNYSIFAEVWQEMKFSLIFWRPTWDQVVEYAELLFFVVKSMIMPPNSLSRRICSLYLMYGVYMKQPGQDYCKFKITHEEWEHLNDLVKYCAKEDLKEQVYIFCKLIQHEAFEFSASPIDLVSEKHMELAASQKCDVKLPENLELDDDHELDELLESPLLQELMDAEKAYNDNKVIDFNDGGLAPLRDLTSHLRKICISKSSKDIDDLREHENAANFAALDDACLPSTKSTCKGSMYKGSTYKGSSKKSPGSTASSVPTGGACAMPATANVYVNKSKKPKGHMIASKCKTPAELKMLLPLEGYENIHSKNNRTLFKKTVPKAEKDKGSPLTKKKKISGGSTVSSDGGSFPSVSAETVSTNLSMPLL